MPLFQQATFLTTVAHLRDLPPDSVREVAFAGRSNGYGYAKAPVEIRAQWEGLIGPYLSKREQLAGLVVIMDIRRPLTDLDLRLIDWFRPTGRPIHILLSKADKVSRQEQTKILRSVKAELATWGGAELYSVQLFSSLKKTGVEEAEGVLAGWLGLENKRAPG
jgi:GTP-binding protein